ncbi:hypothetical protein CYLTODRAFT_425722 [Cylindrobasidium torrendii FP15055 ss-10]|uniref:Transcription regulator Rua1 C-terminal domain-containing protein n=1 Tax=Cylindrobasidium torrendii FP15055 ss-10 TaxID=1314674 RepID=A0A0D7B103_9AGAR|nr:hypothetical protein CYLTODRAFT_425722 [Cylindrobasidium torrendii FP15055 ss-10]
MSVNWASNVWMGVGSRSYSCITPDGQHAGTKTRRTGLTPYGMSTPTRLMSTPKRVREALFKTPTPPRPMSRTPLALSSPGSPELGPLIPTFYPDIFSGDEESPVIHAGTHKRKLSDVEGGPVAGTCKRRSLGDNDKENWNLGRQLFSDHRSDELESEDVAFTSQDPSIVSSSSPHTESFRPLEETYFSPPPLDPDASSEEGRRSAVMLLPSDVHATFPGWFRDFPPLDTTDGSPPGSGAVRNIATGFVRKGSGAASCSSQHSVSLHQSERPAVLSANDLYTPRWVKGKGNAKLGLCPVCYELDGVVAWFPMKVSAYKYVL